MLLLKNSKILVKFKKNLFSSKLILNSEKILLL